jgi:solute:Na+ symporter, SSS family
MFSIVASETSALTFISIPGLAYAGNLGFLQVCAGYILGRIVVARVLLPRYFEGKLVTAYTLLETRFGPETRRFASIVFMVTRAMADSVRVFATAIPIALIMGPVLPREYLMPAAILVLGALTILYTWRGGMRAVVWTELLQAAIYVTGGICAVALLGGAVSGGWSAILSSAGAAGKLRAVSFYTGFDQPHTIFAGLIGGAFLAMASHGTDQLIVQRLLSARSLKDAQRAIIGSGIAVFVQFTLFLTVGLGLWALYGGREFTTPDAIFPTFILEHMPHGLLGLIVAAIVAATMSTHSGAINSLAAATTMDIWLPLRRLPPTEAATFRAGRLFALMWGVVLTGGALLYPESRTPVVVVALSIASFTYGALLGVFFLGIYNVRARQRDAILGMSVGIVVMAAVVFAPSLKIAWPWYVLVGTTITLFAGTLSALRNPAIRLP